MYIWRRPRLFDRHIKAEVHSAYPNLYLSSLKLQRNHAKGRVKKIRVHNFLLFILFLFLIAFCFLISLFFLPYLFRIGRHSDVAVSVLMRVKHKSIEFTILLCICSVCLALPILYSKLLYKNGQAFLGI